jgi:hypothetical protein
MPPGNEHAKEPGILFVQAGGGAETKWGFRGVGCDLVQRDGVRGRF